MPTLTSTEVGESDEVKELRRLFSLAEELRAGVHVARKLGEQREAR